MLNRNSQPVNYLYNYLYLNNIYYSADKGTGSPSGGAEKNTPPSEPDMVVGQKGKMVSRKRSEASKKQLKTNFDKDTTRAITKHVMDIARWEPIDYKDPLQVETRAFEYFMYCEQEGMQVTVPDLALAIGVQRQTLWRWANGDELNPERSDVAKKCYAIIESLVNHYGNTGQIPYVLTIFSLKNHFGYRDQTERIITNNDGLGKNEDTMSIAQRYRDAIVIDPIEEPQKGPTENPEKN